MYTLDGNAFEQGKDGALRNSTVLVGSVVSADGQAQSSKGVDRSLTKILFPYAFIGEGGGIKMKKLTLHRVITADDPENEAEALARDEAMNQAQALMAAIDSRNTAVSATFARTMSSFVIAAEDPVV